MAKPRAASLTRGKAKLIKQYERLVARDLFWDDISYFRQIKNSDEFKKDKEGVRELYMFGIYELCKKANLPPYPWREVVINHIHKGKRWKPDFSDPIFDTCYLRVFTIEKGSSRADVEELNEHYPVAICLSPHATISDLRAYIDDHKDLLDSLLQSTKTHKDLLFNMREPYEAERNKIVMDLHTRGVSSKAIARVLADEYRTEGDRPKFGALTSDDIGRIIRRIKNKN